MPARVWAGVLLDAWPERAIVGLGHASVDTRLPNVFAHRVVDAAVDTMVRYFITRAEDICIVGEGSRCDASFGPGPVSSKAVRRIKDDG